MIAGGNWWRANEIVMRYLTRRLETRYRCRDKAIHSPDAVIHSPAEMIAAWPTTVTKSRWPRAENAEAVLGVVEGDTLDEAGEHLLR